MILKMANQIYTKINSVKSINQVIKKKLHITKIKIEEALVTISCFE